MADSRQASSATARADQPGGGTPASSKSEPDPLIGRVVGGRFKIVSVIARGGMGKVYKAEQAPLGRLCALKVLSPKYEGDRDPEFHKRFFLEASTSAKLTHANTVTIFDYGQEGDDLYYIAMEYIEGRTLHRALREEGPLNEARTAHIAGQICRSLREAHGLGVVHRDLKPGNILLADRADEQDVVKVLDFGLVKDVTGEAEDLTQAGLFMGSPKYMAPEQILGGEITPRTDIYSLGVMMYEMLTGKVPFDRGASVGTLMAHVNDPLPPMRGVNPKIQASPTMENIVYRCLEKEPNKRFNSMKDLLNALKRVGNEDGALTDTHESMPLARIEAQNAIRTSDSIMAPPSNSGPQTITETGRTHTPVFASPSVSETLSSTHASPADTDMAAAAPNANKGRTYVWGGVAVAVALGIGLVVVTSSGSKPAASGEGPATTATQQASAQPTQTATTQAAPTAATPFIRQVRIESDPSGATVSEGDTQLCTSTPCELTWKDDVARAEHRLNINKKGYRTFKATVSPTEEKVKAALEVIPAVAAPPPPPPQQPAGGRPLYKKDF
ncbi:Serine/threonine protein kinase PrkC, regulator of stationary phase [Minicystis rosea]|nr:Serine/threonine protein kinase PrkC, regulator of stationary phase [Minicystis rosea]